MTQPRSRIVSPSRTRYYHCVSRCVRRAWLCGQDAYTRKNFDHRKPWLLQRMKLLAEVFAVHIAAYAVMSNHYHVVLYLDLEQNRSWDRDEVIRRWRRLFRGDPLARAYLRGEFTSESELGQLDVLVACWRERLCDLSWFMRCLNEYLARRANAEDDCKGRFWEGRFKCQALEDEAALLSCMAYVDLNPVRAGLCETLGESHFTSVRERLRRLAEAGDERSGGGTEGKGKEGVSTRDRPAELFPAPRLMPFHARAGESRAEWVDKADAGAVAALPFCLKDYIELVDWTGRIVKTDKKGVIPAGAPPALSALRLSPKQWRMLAVDIQKQAMTMFHGLDRLAAWERRRATRAA